MLKVNLVFLLSSAIILCSGCFNVKNTHDFSYQKLDPDQYLSQINNTPVKYIVDVRTGKEYSRSHIEEATNISLIKFNFRKKVKNFDPQTPVFLYCQTCHRSPLAARKLKKMGFKTVYDLKGGYKNLENGKVN
jgi:rhodanese-related sulfurtransferase